MELRQADITRITEALRSGQSLLVLGESGCGKSHLGMQVGKKLEGYRFALVSYNGAAKETLTAIADQLNLPTLTADEKPKPLTAAQLRDALKDELCTTQTLLIADDTHRWSSSLRYWLEDLFRAGVLLLLLATNPPPKDIFLKLPVVELQPISSDDIRAVMLREAMDQGMSLSPSRLAELQARAGGNLALAKRVVYEDLLGISETRANQEQAQYIDGTPLLIALLAIVGMVRFIGLGLGDKALYLLGGILTLAALAIRSLLYAANRGKRKL